jgi:hypothetical protein
MTLPFRRRSRPRGPARLALAGDFPDTGESVTEILERVRPAGYDGRTYELDAPVLHDTEPLARLRAEPRYQPAAGPQPPPVTGRVLDTLNYLRLKVAILEAAGDADRIDASEQGRRAGQQLLSWSPLREICDDAAALLRRGTS